MEKTMERNVTNVVEQTINSQLALVEADIKNCPDNLWEEKCGGDPYWRQLYHLLCGMRVMLNFPEDAPPQFPLPEEAGRLQGAVITEPHGKDIILKFLEDTKNYLSDYFKRLNDNMLFAETDFYGRTLPLLAVLLISSGHILYHVGVCDAALREKGAKASM